jgi:hypothetical protein
MWSDDTTLMQTLALLQCNSTLKLRVGRKKGVTHEAVMWLKMHGALPPINIYDLMVWYFVPVWYQGP